MKNQRETLGFNQLLAVPVGALHQAQTALCELSLDFLKLGFQPGADGVQEAITRSYVIPRRVASASGEVQEDLLRVDAPILALMPIPNLSVDLASTTISAEVVRSRDDGSGSEVPELRCTPTAGPQSRRASDRSPRADLEIRLKSGPPSEGLSRLLDRLVEAIEVSPQEPDDEAWRSM